MGTGSNAQLVIIRLPVRVHYSKIGILEIGSLKQNGNSGYDVWLDIQYSMQIYLHVWHPSGWWVYAKFDGGGGGGDYS